MARIEGFQHTVRYNDPDFPDAGFEIEVLLDLEAGSNGWYEIENVYLDASGLRTIRSAPLPKLLEPFVRAILKRDEPEIRKKVSDRQCDAYWLDAADDPYSSARY